MVGIAAGLEIGGVSRYLSVPFAAAAVTALVLAGSFHRVEIVLLVLSSVFVTYIASGILAHPRWGQAARGLVVPDLPPAVTRSLSPRPPSARRSPLGGSPSSSPTPSTRS